jgi:UPF0716 family protein affecting phage T7 exclusion
VLLCSESGSSPTLIEATGFRLLRKLASALAGARNAGYALVLAIAGAIGGGLPLAAGIVTAGLGFGAYRTIKR